MTKRDIFLQAVKETKKKEEESKSMLIGTIKYHIPQLVTIKNYIKKRTLK